MTFSALSAFWATAAAADVEIAAAVAVADDD